MPDALEDDLLILLCDASRHLRTYGDQLAQAHGMTRAQLIILARLERQPELSQNELAAIAEVAPMTVARLIDRLEEHGMVKRCPDHEDRRIWRLRLTPAAAPILREIGRFRAKLLTAATRRIEPSVLKAMAVGLRQMKKNISAHQCTEETANRSATARR